ncbi:No apical meristem (NAM) protein [Cynara cardunculus var. scolymus]|uniref:No apical meristem (NAM) protein n=1 Tax=Cynara cardunculus var. scolymus TaxID=59895 RepID=A0A103YKW4_CYNCS|nr:No apical meristem (NAM) protein [Cynara cardunculus var. scolymus]
MGETNVNLPPGFRFCPTDEELVNRATSNGFWKSCGGDEQIVSSNGSKRIGVKKYYVFHVGEAPEGIKTNWIMQEFRVSDASTTSSRSRRRDTSKSVSFISSNSFLL